MTLKELQEDFWENMGDVFGYDIIGSESHPLKKAFELYCEMREEQEEDSEEEEEEEVRCVCPTCFGEGWTFVSAERAKEFKREELMEECCPYGDKCKEEEDSEEEEKD